MSLFTSHIRHSFSSEDNTGKVVCQLGCQEVVTIGSSLLVSPHSFECDESKCFLASATLTKIYIYFFLEKVMEALCDKLWSAFECTCTSVVHVAGHYRVEIPILEVKQKSSFRPVSFQAHQSIKNDLQREKTKLNKHLSWLFQCPQRWQHCSPKPDCDALWSWILSQFSAPAGWSSLLGFWDSVHFVAYGSELVQSHLFSLSIQILATKHSLLYLPAWWIWP